MDSTKPTINDMPANGWIDRHAPAPLRPYLKLMRLDRPIGTWLLALPCWWSISLACGALPVATVSTWGHMMGLFAIGAVIMRGAGCTINDILDRDIDVKVARTASRPLACGALTVRQALWFLFFELMIGLAVLVQLNKQTIILGACSVVLLAVYPMMKRLTHWPQAWLGLTFNWGAILGWTAVRGTLDLPPLLLYAGAFFWTLGYDTIYAHQDRDDDRHVGVKSSALALGTRTVPFVGLVYTVALGLMTLSLALAGVHWVAYPLLALAGLQLLWQVWTVDIDNAANCLLRFRSNRYFGWLVLGAISVGVILDLA